MPKLHLKETPEERAERKWRKAQKAERKSRKKSHLHSHAEDEQERPHKRRRTADDEEPRGASWEGDEGWVPPQSSTKIDHDQIRVEVEERMFREKLFDAMQDDYDHRLDGVEAQFNDYGHVPNRWKATSLDDHELFEHTAVNPNEMADDEYAEWISEGMWRRTHKAEMEERERKKSERKARKEQERKAREETKRLERQREAERKLKREFKERRRLREAWEYYEARWKVHTNIDPPDKPLKFQDVAWPIFSVPTTTDDLTSERISAFLLYDLDDAALTGESKTRRERIRDALLRWHPDKFQGKMGSRLDEREREMVLDGVGIVARCLNAMMAS